MQKRFLPVLMLCLLLTGCGGREPPAGLQGTVSTDGSTSMADVMAVLQEAFREKCPGVTVNYSGTGSGAGVEAALSGACDIGLTSRELRPEEAAQGAAAHLIALDAVAVVVNPCRPLEDLSLERLAGIFTGRITTWDQLGCGEGPIAVYGREAGSGTRTAFEDLHRGRDCKRVLQPQRHRLRLPGLRRGGRADREDRQRPLYRGHRPQRGLPPPPSLPHGHPPGRTAGGGRVGVPGLRPERGGGGVPVLSRGHRPVMCEEE